MRSLNRNNLPAKQFSINELLSAQDIQQKNLMSDRRLPWKAIVERPGMAYSVSRIKFFEMNIL